MTEQHIAVCEALDWRVHDDPEEDYVELEKYSPAGEDFIFGVQKGNFVKNVREYADGFDVDEHVELWIEGRGKNGVPATARELVEDAEAIRDMLNELRRGPHRRLRKEGSPVMKYERLTQAQKDRHPSIHHTGSVRGMKKLGFWRKKDRCVRCGQYIYNLSMTIR